MVLLSVESIQGKRKYMEDRYAYLEKGNIIIALICDGHGGSQVADDSARELPKRLFKVVSQTEGNNVRLAEEIRRVIMEWGAKRINDQSGSTLTGIVTKRDTVFIFNIGDSRTCFKLEPASFIYMLPSIFDKTGEFIKQTHIDYMRKNFFCTMDHNEESDYETSRVDLAGGKIFNKRLNGVLSVTRALGDLGIGPGLSFAPDVYWTKRALIVGPILLYSDGIYELQNYGGKNFDDVTLYNIASRFNAKVLANYALKSGSSDNITAMLVKV